MAETTEEERALLGAMVERFLSDQANSKRSVGGYPAQDPQVWRGLAELGVLGINFDPEFGGLGLGWPEVASVMRALGRSLAVEPYLPTVVLAGGLVARGGDQILKAELLPEIARGRLKAAFAFAEPASRYNLACVATTATANAGGFLLDGRKSVVLGAPDADVVFVSARTAGDVRSTDGVSLFAVPRHAPGVSVTEFLTIDGRSAGDVDLEAVRVNDAAVLGVVGAASPLIEEVIDEATVAICVEAVGAMERLNALTLEHCKTRIVFGEPLSRLQAVQHHLVDMHVAYEHAAAITDAAVAALALDPRRRALTVSAAKAVIAREGAFIGKWAVQLHGAAGTTEDLDVGRYFKRLLAANMMFGGDAHHQRRYFNLRREPALREMA